MMDKVLERLQTLQAELAAIDPSRDLDVADQVAAMAAALRDTLVHAGVGEAGARRDAPLPAMRQVG